MRYLLSINRDIIPCTDLTDRRDDPPTLRKPHLSVSMPQSFPLILLSVATKKQTQIGRAEIAIDKGSAGDPKFWFTSKA